MTENFTPATFESTQPLGVGYYTPPNDPVGWLGPAARERLKMLRQRVSDLRALCPAFEEVHKTSTAKLEAERILERMVAPAARGGFGSR